MAEKISEEKPPELDLTKEAEGQLKSEKEESRELLPVPKGGIEVYPLSGAVQDIIAAGGIRGQGFWILFHSYTRRLESELNQIRQEKNEATSTCTELNDKYRDEKEKNAVLEERIQTSQDNERIRKGLTSLGGIVIGVSIKFITTDQIILPLAALLAGGCLLVLGWFLPRSRRKES